MPTLDAPENPTAPLAASSALVDAINDVPDIVTVPLLPNGTPVRFEMTQARFGLREGHQIVPVFLSKSDAEAACRTKKCLAEHVATLKYRGMSDVEATDAARAAQADCLVVCDRRWCIRAIRWVR